MNALGTQQNQSLYRRMIAVALPIALQSLISQGLNLIDNFMVGSLGEVELNAVGIGSQIFFVYNMLAYGFAAGTATYIAQYYGIRDLKSIRRTIGFAITCMASVGAGFLVISLAFPEEILGFFSRSEDVIHAGAGYVRIVAISFLFVAVSEALAIALRSTQQTKLPLIGSSAALIMNTCLNYMLIFGKLGMPELGIKGAAIATAISRTVEMILMIVFVLHRRNILSGRLGEFFAFDKGLIIKILKNSLPTAFNETFWSMGLALYIVAYSRISVSAGAAIQACNTIDELFFMVAFSIGDAILILVGEKLGQGETEEAYQMARRMIRIGVIIGILLGIMMVGIGLPMLRVFDFTEEGRHYATQILLIYGCFLWMEVYNAMQLSGTLRSGGDTKFAMYIDVGCTWLIGVPAAFITALVLHWPVVLVALSIKLESIAKLVFVTIRYLSKRWLRVLVDHK